MKSIITKVIAFFRNLFKNKSVATASNKEYKHIPQKLSYKEWKALKKRMQTPRSESICRGCGGTMLVSPGQIAYFHSECRTKGRNNNALAFK